MRSQEQSDESRQSGNPAMRPGTRAAGTAMSGGVQTGNRGGICPSCFRAGMYGSSCSLCGFDPAKEAERPLALRYFHALRSGTYFTGRVLGQGGFGITYLSRCGQRSCCIKEYVPDDLSCRRDSSGNLVVPSGNRKEFLEGKNLFLDEARALQQFREISGVVDIWDYFEENNTCYFVMEYLDGSNLRSFQRENKGRRDVLRATADRAVLEMGRALGEIHRHGLIHGDVSPENIMLTKSGRIKLIDFGTARVFRAGGGKETRTFVKTGYAPYEMYLPDQRVGPWSDVYSLAATYYALLAGVKVPDARERKEKDVCPLLKDICPDVSPQLSGVIEHALMTDYRDRTDSMEVFVAELESVLGRSASPPKRSAAPAADSGKAHAPAAAGPQKPAATKGRFSLFGVRSGDSRIRVYLEMQVGTRAQRSWRLALDTKMTVGRSRDNDIVLPTDSRLSRSHCDIEFRSRDRCLWITDHSSRGTYRMDGSRLPGNQACRIRPGEEFFLSEPPTYRFKVIVE